MYVTVILPSWNTRELLLECIRKLYNGPGIALVVVDNASTDGSADAVESEFPNVILLRNSKNLGFAGAVNRGIAYAMEQGESGPLVLLNPDTLCEPELLMDLASELQRRPDVGLIAPGLRLPDGSPQPYAYGDDPSLSYLLRRGWSRLIHRRALHNWAISEAANVDWVSFACVCIRRDAIAGVGDLDEHFFMYFEDNDWGIRARRAGWKIRYDPGGSIIHIGGASLKLNPDASRAYCSSLTFFYSKHYPRWHGVILRCLLPVYARCLFKNKTVSLRRGGDGYIRTLAVFSFQNIKCKRILYITLYCPFKGACPVNRIIPMPGYKLQGFFGQDDF